MKLSKNLKTFTKLQEEVVSLDQIINYLKKSSFVKFESSIELSINLHPQKKALPIRGMFSLPFSTLKKEFKVAVFSRDNTAQYGADRVGAEDLIEEIQKGKIEYDCYMSTEEMAPVIAKLAKILGPRGLFPTKKTNTINDNPAATIQTFKRGVLKYTANNNIIHAKIAHIKMSNKEITDNIFGLIKDISSISLKKTKEIIKSVYISSTMGHSVKIPCSLILD